MKSSLVSRKKMFHVVRFKIDSFNSFDETSYFVLLSTPDKYVAIEQFKRYKQLYKTAGCSDTIAIITKSYTISVQY